MTYVFITKSIREDKTLSNNKQNVKGKTENINHIYQERKEIRIN